MSIDIQEDQVVKMVAKRRARDQELSFVVKSILHTGIVRHPRDVLYLFGVCAFLLCVGSVYMIASSVPPTPTLGSDFYLREKPLLLQNDI